LKSASGRSNGCSPGKISSGACCFASIASANYTTHSKPSPIPWSISGTTAGADLAIVAEFRFTVCCAVILRARTMTKNGVGTAQSSHCPLRRPLFPINIFLWRYYCQCRSKPAIN
jgi:hypothetical protein